MISISTCLSKMLLLVFFHCWAVSGQNWIADGWGPCSKTCGWGTRERTYTCSTGSAADCDGITTPGESDHCLTYSKEQCLLNYYRQGCPEGHIPVDYVEYNITHFDCGCEEAKRVEGNQNAECFGGFPMDYRGDCIFTRNCPRMDGKPKFIITKVPYTDSSCSDGNESERVKGSREPHPIDVCTTHSPMDMPMVKSSTYARCVSPGRIDVTYYNSNTCTGHQIGTDTEILGSCKWNPRAKVYEYTYWFEWCGGLPLINIAYPPSISPSSTEPSLSPSAETTTPAETTTAETTTPAETTTAEKTTIAPEPSMSPSVKTTTAPPTEEDSCVDDDAAVITYTQQNGIDGITGCSDLPSYDCANEIFQGMCPVTCGVCS